MSINSYRDRGERAYAPTPKQEAVYEERLQCEPRPKMSRAGDRAEIGPESETTYPTATEMLDDLFKTIESLEMETASLFARIDTVLTEDGPECNPTTGPRVSTSVLTYRIGHAADLIDELTRRIRRINRRVTL